MTMPPSKFAACYNSLMPTAPILFALAAVLTTSAALAQSSSQSPTPALQIPTRNIEKENDINCFAQNTVEATYPREARLANIQGSVKLRLIIAENGSVADLYLVSGDPLLAQAAMAAVRQWH